MQLYAPLKVIIKLNSKKCEILPNIQTTLQAKDIDWNSLGCRIGWRYFFADEMLFNIKSTFSFNCSKLKKNNTHANQPRKKLRQNITFTQIRTARNTKAIVSKVSFNQTQRLFVCLETIYHDSSTGKWLVVFSELHLWDIIKPTPVALCYVDAYQYSSTRCEPLLLSAYRHLLRIPPPPPPVLLRLSECSAWPTLRRAGLLWYDAGGTCTTWLLLVLFFCFLQVKKEKKNC